MSAGWEDEDSVDPEPEPEPDPEPEAEPAHDGGDGDPHAPKLVPVSFVVNGRITAVSYGYYMRPLAGRCGTSPPRPRTRARPRRSRTSS